MIIPRCFKGMVVAFACIAVPCSSHAAGEPASAAAAHAEVARAQEAVAAAQARGALWTTARDALRAAQAALQTGDHDAAVKAARFAAQQAQLGIDQLAYPRFPE